MGLANSPMHQAQLRVVSGNFVIAKPKGVLAGIDYGFTGDVRRIDQQAITHWLQNNTIVLLSPIGYSVTGEAFNISAEAVAMATARALHADKLLMLYEGADLVGADGQLIRQLKPSDAVNLLTAVATMPGDVARHLEQAVEACRAGVRRVHLLKRCQDGALLLELFTRDGIGTMLTADIYDDIRKASIDDVGGVLELIRPLEEAGVLMRRSRELLEVEIERFTIIERDGKIIGCAALYPFADEQIGELACVAINHEYRNQGRAESLLEYIERQARQQGLQQLFVLTTQTSHWFQEHGFSMADLTELPVTKQAMYNWQRRSRVLIKTL